MSQRARTPRQRQGDDLRPLMVRVTPELYARIVEAAAAQRRSKADVAREALDAWFFADKL